VKISEVIERLQQIQKDKGNLVCVAQDGGDPSDFCIVTELEVVNECRWFMGDGLAVAFYS